MSEQLGDRIGRYKLLQKIGEGGCGVVYMAEQIEPVRRRVALKVIKLGMDTKSVVARFEAERQALALMDHPNIARVIDGGSTDQGRPYFVMELVRGMKITDYCDQHELGVPERLDLFLQVCQAVQHAHQKGIIHRDLKPSNILVTVNDGVAVPKVIDFGVAKATEQRLTDKTIFTEFHAFVGTPAYMSPEQAEMSSLDIDTRSDIYSLGVLLYELLTGRTPFEHAELVQSGLDEMRRTIREKEPSRPSLRVRSLSGDNLTTTAKRRRMDVPRLVSSLEGDLDWIVMKALEKDRTRRYETANGLAADVRRHLSDEPVVARPPSARYRLQKAVLRNRGAFAAGGAIAAALLVGTIVSSWQATRATRMGRMADAARTNELNLRVQAEAQALAERQRAYASDMNLLQQALAINNLGRAQALLNRQVPQPGQKDLRGWEWRYLWGQCQSDPFLQLCQKTNRISSLAVSHDGKWLAVGEGNTGSLTLWDLATRREVNSLPAGGADVRAAFSPRELFLAFTFETKISPTNVTYGVRLWDGQTGRIVATIPLDGLGYIPAFSQDGRTLALSAMTPTNTISLWSVPEGKFIAAHPATLPADVAGPATAFALSGDLSLAAHPDDGSVQDRVHLIDLRTGRERWSRVAAEEWITALAISPDGSLLASGAGYVESDVRSWNLESGVELARLSGHRAWVSSIVFWPDGKTMASASADQTIRVWDLSDPAKPRTIQVLRGHTLEVWRLALLKDNATLVSGGKDGSVYLWDTRLAKPVPALITLPANVAAWRFGQDSHSVLTLSPDGQVNRWTGPEFQNRETLLQTDVIQPSLWAYVSHDGRYVASAGTNGAVRVWDLQRRTLVREVQSRTGPAFPVTIFGQGKSLLIRDSSDSSFEQWDLNSGMKVNGWSGVVSPWVSGCALSPDEKQFVMIGYNTGEGWLRNLSTGNQRPFSGGLPNGAQVAFSLDGKLFAATSETGFTRLWETETLRTLATFSGFMLGASSPAFSPDATRLAVGSSGKEAIKIWDLHSLHDLLTLEGVGSGFFNTAFSPDGNILGSMTMGSGLLHLWRAPSWEQIAKTEPGRQGSR